MIALTHFIIRFQTKVLLLFQIIAKLFFFVSEYIFLSFISELRTLEKNFFVFFLFTLFKLISRLLKVFFLTQDSLKY